MAKSKEPAPGKPWVFVNWTDEHFGSAFGPNPNGTPLQKWIWRRMVATNNTILDRFGGKFSLHHGYGGEFVDKGGLFERNLASTNMAKIHAAASASHVVRGTAYHVGEDGDEDTQVAQNLGISDISEAKRFELDGRLIWHTHHGPKPSVKPSTRANALNAAASDIYWNCLENGDRIPDLVIYGHWHQMAVGQHSYIGPDGSVKYIKVAASPAWKVWDRYTFKAVPTAPPAKVGVMLYIPSANKLETISYRVPAQYTRGIVGKP